MTVTVCWAVKGGSGTTVVAACLALSRPDTGLLVDLDGELPAVLGVPEPAGQGLCDWFATDLPPETIEDLRVPVDATTHVIPRGASAIPPDSSRWSDLLQWLSRSPVDVVIDAGTGALPPALATGHPGVRRTLVTRACYLALRRAARDAARPDAIVLVVEPGRALGRRDVEHALGAPVIATVSLDPRVARAVDAGLLSARLPHGVARELRTAPTRPDRAIRPLTPALTRLAR